MPDFEARAASFLEPRNKVRNGTAMTATVARFLRDCSGSTALEYAIIGSVISIALILAATTIGTSLNGMISAIAAQFK